MMSFLLSSTAAVLLSAQICPAQVFSPKVLRSGQPDATDLRAFAAQICARAHANTPREKAEAIWRYFLTDGRFVKPGFWYHIAGWAYEEPAGEVLDPMKLLNSYGFGLCYQIAPLLEAVWEAAGFEDARVWFLTGHTVTEVFYDGSYHYFDSDMMGYNPVGEGPLKRRRVASVSDIERDPSLMLAKMADPRHVKPGTVDEPWYPGDVREAAMDGLAELFSTTKDNWLFPYTRYPQGHSMDFVLRPGEKMIRYFAPQPAGSFNLPHKFDGSMWTEFPQEISQHKIRTENGPKSQRDARLWGTGRLEYRPAQEAPQYDVTSPYVIMDAEFAAQVLLAGSGARVAIETSTDGGHTWERGSERAGPYAGTWTGKPRVLAQTEHGRRSAVTGVYTYLVRFKAEGGAKVSEPVITTRFQVNPRTLPALETGRNEITYSAGAPVVRREVTVDGARIGSDAWRVRNAMFKGERGQGYVVAETGGPAEVTFELAADAGFAAGARFLDLRQGIAPDKLTAETRQVTPYGGETARASIAWATAPAGPYKTLWEYSAPKWLDGNPVNRVLLWPEVDQTVRELPAGTKKVYVRYRAEGLAIDSFRLAALNLSRTAAAPFDITHVWREHGMERRHVEHMADASLARTYTIEAGADVENVAVIFQAPAP